MELLVSALPSVSESVQVPFRMDLDASARARSNRFGDVPSQREDCHDEPWVEMLGWGRGVVVRSPADLESVRGLIVDEGTFRRAVVFENLTIAERRELMVAIEEFGVELGEFTDSDRKANTFPTPRVKDKALTLLTIVLASPTLVARRLQGRTTQAFELSPAAGESEDITSTSRT